MRNTASRANNADRTRATQTIQHSILYEREIRAHGILNRRVHILPILAPHRLDNLAPLLLYSANAFHKISHREVHHPDRRQSSVHAARMADSRHWASILGEHGVVNVALGIVLHLDVLYRPTDCYKARTLLLECEGVGFDRLLLYGYTDMLAHVLAPRQDEEDFQIKAATAASGGRSAAGNPWFSTTELFLFLQRTQKDLS
jgi:hypothetical protein